MVLLTWVMTWDIAIAVGDMKLKLCDGKVILKGVKHVSGLTRNHNSIGLLHEEGWLY